ncbi:mitochondrial-processing peptidase subunit alpha-like isoform X2 [Silene latifolia]|uniref:mitochondrial-processing peptidase subunit alpha-like isoform X2 n=1 Tax=Silene latifolia TaxID=37657 RepID=UPI003D773FC0
MDFLMQNPVASIGLYIHCGSVYESPQSFGATHLLQLMAFKTTLNRTQLRLIREVEAIGGSIASSVSPEQMSYTFAALKTYLPEMVELLVDSVRNPAFLDWEVNETLQELKGQLIELPKYPSILLLEAVHTAGYVGALSNSLVAQEAIVDSLNSSVLEEFVMENYTAPHMVLVASGVEHEELLSIAEPLLSDLSSVPPLKEPRSAYLGGDYRCQAGSGVTHFALAFELPGGWQEKEKDSMVLSVLQMLMGGGDRSFSARDHLGKGMCSRLYLNVLNQYPEVHHMSAYSRIYTNTGLFVVQATANPQFVSKAIEIAASELKAVASPGYVDPVQVDRAKAAKKSAILMNLESRMTAADEIGRQILTYGESKPVDHFLNIIDEITMKDITSVAEKLLSSPLTMASLGNVCYVPSYDTVSRLFQSK